MVRFLAGELSFQEQRRHRLQDIFKSPLSDADADSYFKTYLTLYEADWRLHDDVLPCLARLTPCKLGVISDGGGEQQRKKLARTGILDKFSVAVTAEEAGVGPSPTPGFSGRRVCWLASLQNTAGTWATTE